MYNLSSGNNNKEIKNIMTYTIKQLEEQRDYLKSLKMAYNPNLDILKNEPRAYSYGSKTINLRHIFKGISIKEFRAEIKEIRGLEYDLRVDYKNWKNELVKTSKTSDKIIEFYIKGQEWGEAFLRCYFSILYSKISKGLIHYNNFDFKEEFLHNFLYVVYETIENGEPLKLFLMGVRAASLTTKNQIVIPSKIKKVNKKSGKLQYYNVEDNLRIEEATFNNLIMPIDNENKENEKLIFMIIEKVGYMAYDNLVEATRLNKANQRDNKAANLTKNKIKRNIRQWIKEQEQETPINKKRVKKYGLAKYKLNL